MKIIVHVKPVPHDVLVQSVNALELHKALQVKTKYTDWIKKRIEKYDFIEDIDYVRLKTEICGEINGLGFPIMQHEYHVSIVMAKELAMLENNEIGKNTRRYYIECETRLMAELKHQLEFMRKSTMLEFYQNEHKLLTKKIAKLEEDK